jgi:hypothetical protein
MRLHRSIFITRIDEKPRVLFSIFEKPNGELIIPIRTSERYGTDYSSGSPILEQRFSIHPSLKSQEYTTAKHTTNLQDGRQVTSVALTDAVKQKTGFSLIFALRAPNMAPDKYLLSDKDKGNSKFFELPPTNPLTATLYYGLLVGSPEIEFKASDPQLLVFQHRYKRFRIVLLATWFLGSPSHHTSEFLHVLTADPETPSSSTERMFLRQFMRESQIPFASSSLRMVHILSRSGSSN